MRLHQAGWTITRISITDQLVVYCTHELLDFHCHRTPAALRYRIDGVEFTREEAAHRFLGGYGAAFGRSGDDFDAFLAGLDAPQESSE